MIGGVGNVKGTLVIEAKGSGSATMVLGAVTGTVKSLIFAFYYLILAAAETPGHSAYTFSMIASAQYI